MHLTKNLHSPISGAPLELWQLRKTITKKISSPIFLPTKTAGARGWGDGFMDKLLATVRTKFISSEFTKKMLSGYGHSQAILPADGNFLLQLRKLPANKIQSDQGRFLTYISCLLTHAHVHIHVLPYTWKHTATANQNTQTHAKKIQLNTVNTTK